MPNHQHDEDEDQPPEQISIFQFIERAVDAALQARGMHDLQLSLTVKEIVQVAEQISDPESDDVRKGLFDPKKISAVDRESVIQAIAIYKLVAADMFGISSVEMEKRVQAYTKKFRT